MTIAINDQSTTLHQAVINSDTAFAQILPTHGVDLNVQGNLYWNSFYHAVIDGNKDIVELFIKSSAEVNMRNIQNQTPFDMA